MCKLLTSSGGSYNLSIGFDRDCGRREQELTNNKNIRCKYHVRIMLKSDLVLSKIKKKLLTD